MQCAIRASMFGLVCLMMWVPPASAQGQTVGPFGLRKGLTKAEAEKISAPLEEGPAGIYRTERVPRPDAQFQSYWLVITPESGLCAVMAAGTAMEINPEGAQVRAAFAKARTSLAARYGEPAAVQDGLQRGSALTRPTDWSTSLAAQQRSLVAMWKLESHPAGIVAISLEAAGLNASRAYVRTVFGFDNEDGCIAELRNIRQK